MSYFETSFYNLRAQARNLPIWCANIWTNCKCVLFPLYHLLSQDLRLQLRICALSHATSPPGVNTTLTRASHSDRHTGKLAPTISILHLVLQLASYLMATLPSCSICQTFEKLTWGVQRSLWSSRTSRLVSFKTATRLPCADMYHTDVGQGEEKTAYHACFVLPHRRRTSKSRNRTRCPIKNISLTQITKMTTKLLPHVKSTSARHEKGVQN